MQTSSKMKRCRCCGEMYKPFSSMTKTCGLSCASKLVDIEISEKKLKQSKKTVKPKAKTAAWLKINKLWPLFSLHQKLVHSADGEWCQCYTCDQPIKIGTINCQGGHAVPKSVYKNLYFDERAVRPQCVQCNKNRGGMSYDFCLKLREEIGTDSFNDMIKHGKDLVKRDSKWYLDQIAYYKAQNEIIYKIKQTTTA